jgi:NADPH:quinone reductase-like Zn-dependent oxidoreductase
LQFALAAGATVIMASSSDDKLQVVEKLGAHHSINYITTPNWEEEVMNIVCSFILQQAFVVNPSIV